MLPQKELPMIDSEARRSEVRNNHIAFKKALPVLLEQSYGKFALFRHEELVGIFESCNDAYVYGSTHFPDGIFSSGHIVTYLFDERGVWI